LSYDTGQRRTGIIVTARDRYDTFANATLENAFNFRLGIADRNVGRWFVGAQLFERRACVIMGQEGAESTQQLQLTGISARRTHDHYLAHRLFSISGRRFEGALARIIQREYGAALPGLAASSRYRKAWGQFGQAVVAIENDEAFTCGYAVVFFVGHAVVHFPFIKSTPTGPVQRDSH
jgi:hypothetical protein